MKTKLALVLGLCLAYGAIAISSVTTKDDPERYGLKGNPLGMSLESFMTKHRRATGGSIAPFTSKTNPVAFGEIGKIPGITIAKTHFPFECYDGPQVSVAGVPTELEYYFIADSAGERLYCIRGSFGADGYDSVAAALKEKYGAPKGDEQFPVQNRMGATFTNRNMTWLLNGDAIRLLLYAGDLENSSITIVEERGLLEAAKRLNAIRASKAKDL